MPRAAKPSTGPAAAPTKVTTAAAATTTAPRAAETPAPAAPPPPPVHNARQVELILQQLANLPTLSPVATRVMRLGSASDADFDHIISLIEADPTLSARLLSMCRRANVASAAGKTITTVRRAVVLLGLEAVQAAVLSVQVYEMMQQDPAARERRTDPNDATPPGPGFDRVGFWTHSIGVACACELLAAAHRELRVRPEEAFVAGLVHDLGKLVLDWVLPRTYSRVVQLAASRSISLAEAERTLVGVDHHLVGKRLGEHWGLPHMYQDAMWLHGQPVAVLPPVNHRGLIALVTLGDVICRGLHLGWSGSHEPPPDPEALATELGLKPARVRECIPKIHEIVARRARDLGLGEHGGSELVVRSIAAANARLGELHAAGRLRAALSRRQARVLDAITRFAAAAPRCAGVNDALAAVARSFAEFTTQHTAPQTRRLTDRRPAPAQPPVAPPSTAPLAAIFQAREGEPWRLVRFTQGPAGIEHAPGLHAEPPRRADGSPMPLADLARPEALGNTVALIHWLSEHMLSVDSPHQPTQPPDIRSLRFLPLVCTRGPTAVLLHDRQLSDAPAARRLLDAARAVWSSAIAAAAQHEGARRMAEALAQTTRVLTDTQSRLAERQSMARLGELTAGAAHEINTPLAVISGRAQLLAQRLAGKDLDDARHIALAAEGLSELIARLHLVARPPAPAPVPCDPRELLALAARNAAEPARVAVEPITDPRLASAQLDTGSLARVLDELIDNALQAAPDTRVRLGAHIDPDGSLVLTVADDGPGMSSHALRHAFDPFFSAKPAGRRSGLGLAIARTLVLAHAGRIELSSQPGRGTHARVTFPDWGCPQALHAHATRVPAEHAALLDEQLDAQVSAHLHEQPLPGSQATPSRSPRRAA